MFQLEADQFAALRKQKLAAALAARLTGDPWQGALDPASGDVLATDRLGCTSRFGFDEQGFIGSITSPLGRTWQLHNGPKGRLDGLTSPAGLGVGFDYDANYGRLTGIRRGDGTALRIGYDEQGQPAELAWPDGSRTAFRFSGERLVARTDRLGQQEGYAWDTAGRLTAITNANGQTTTFDYGEWNRPEVASFPDGRREYYRYDEAGRLREWADDQGLIATLDYDGDSTRIAAIQYSDGEVLRYRYDAAGHVQSAEAPAAKASFVWDEAGRLTTETLAGATAGYTYDARGSLTELRYPDGSTLGFRYDADQRLVALRDWNGGVSVWDYPDETQTVTRHANGCETRTALDPTGLPARLTLHDPRGALLADTRYARDGEERLVASADARCGRRDYHYDREGRLLGVVAPDPIQTERFGYDPAGNRVDCNGERATFDAADRLLQSGRATFEYNGGGELTQLVTPTGTWQLTWSRRGLLTAAVSARGQRLDFGYDAFGRRVFKRVTPNDGSEPTITRYAWAGEHLIAERTRRGEQLLHRQHYAFLPGSYVPFATRIDGEPYYYHCDHLGTPKRLTGADGRLVWEADHRACGEAVLRLAQVNNPWRLPGQYLDAETGLHYNRFRYYSPTLGRYLSRDPLTFLAGANFFSYVDGDPINAADPLGLWWKAVASIAAGVAAAAIVVATAPVSLPVLAAAAVIGVGVGVGVNKVLNLKELCLSCAIEAFAQGFLQGAVGAVAVAAAVLLLPEAVATVAIVGLSSVAIYSMLQEHLGWEVFPWEDGSQSYFEMTPAEQSASLGSLCGVFSGAGAASRAMIATRPLLPLKGFGQAQAARPKGVFRDKNGYLRDGKGRFVRDPNRAPTGKYPRNMSERKKALLRDMDDPNSNLSAQARQFIRDTKGNRVPPGYRVHHKQPLYTKKTHEGKKKLDVAKNMETVTVKEHNKTHGLNGKTRKKYPPKRYR